MHAHVKKINFHRAARSAKARQRAFLIFSIKTALNDASSASRMKTSQPRRHYATRHSRGFFFCALLPIAASSLPQYRGKCSAESPPSGTPYIIEVGRVRGPRKVTRERASSLQIVARARPNFHRGAIRSSFSSACGARRMHREAALDIALLHTCSRRAHVPNASGGPLPLF